MSPFPLTVKLGTELAVPHDPVLVLTVARVYAPDDTNERSPEAGTDTHCEPDPTRRFPAVAVVEPSATPLILTTVVASDPAVLVTSPVSAGAAAVGSVPDVICVAAMAMLLADAAVTRPLPSMVSVMVWDASPNEPVLELTVASVVMNDPTGDDTSPLSYSWIFPVCPLTD